MRPESALLLAVIVAAGCRRPEPEPAAPPRQVRCAAAQARQVRDTVELRGTIAPRPDRDAQIAAQVAGRILRVLVREGDAVAAGQEVARIDAAPLADEAEQAEAARAKVAAERRNAEATRDRTERVFQHGIAARQEVDDAVTRAEAARAAEGEATAAARRARRQVERAILRSPLAGVVVRVMRRPGELVDGTPATPVLEVADPNHLEIVADVTALDLVRVEKGQPAAVTVNVLPSTSWSAAVVAVSPAVDPATGLGVVRAEIDAGQDRRPPIGVLGNVRIFVGPPRDAVLVPKAAIRLSPTGQSEVVVCGADALAHTRPVERRTRDGEQEEVTGVRAGEKVAVDPVLGIDDGDRLQVAP
jgi:RND family efflux transporter MFP subunit